MSSYGFRERVLEIGTDGAALASSTTQTSLFDSTAKGKEFTLGAGRLREKFAIAFMFSGRISTVVTTPGTLSLALRLGSVDVLASGAMTLNTTAQTNVNWVLEGEIVCRAVGLTTTTTFMPKGCKWSSHAVIGSAAPTAGTAGTHLLPYNAAPAVGSGLDFSVSQLFDLLATWSVSNASNSIQLHAGHIDLYT